MRPYLTTISAGAALVTLAAAQDGATAVRTTMTLDPIGPLPTDPADILLTQSVTFIGTAILYSGKTLVATSGSVYLIDQNGTAAIAALSGTTYEGEIIGTDVTVSGGQFITNGVPVSVVATLTDASAASSTPATMSMSNSTGSTSPSATSSEPAKSASDRVVISRVVAAVSVFLAALGSL